MMEFSDFDFTPRKSSKCVHCGRPKLDHKAVSLQCPMGKKHRVLGFTFYSTNDVFTEKVKK